MQDPPACSLGVLLQTLFDVTGSALDAEFHGSIDDALQDLVIDENGGTLPTITEAPAFSMEKIIWNLCIFENGSAPTLSRAPVVSNEQLIGNLALDAGVDFHYFRPGGVDTYFRPGGVDTYIRH